MKSCLYLALAGLLTSSLWADEIDDTPFRALDRDGDKVVTYLEFATKKKTEFDAMDRNRDRSVTQEEHEAASLAEAETAAAEEEGSKVFKADVFALPEFKAMDKDQDLAVSLMEFGDGVKSTFSALDAMESGETDERISLVEFQVAVQQAKAKAMQAEALKKGSAPKGSAPK